MDPALAALVAAGSRTELTGLAGWVVSVIEALGPFGVGVLVALENLFPPIPSEVVLPVAGYVASQGGMSLVWAVVAATTGAVVGAWALYGLGAWVGRVRIHRWLERIPLMDAQDLDQAEGWFLRHGGAAVLIGRCVPVVRSLISVPAGVERMNPWRFTLYTLVGSAVWNGGLVWAGHALGSQWQDIGRYSDWLNAVVYAVMAVVLARFVWARTGARAERRRAARTPAPDGPPAPER
ncbi:DedA family protein [Cellulomonas sp. zg-ZUI199]|uniref:DedA family protein n=1 Tax=Cellulomonas wangleii TaxID=2816956 RepID=A0ABX8D623_9CELL|nr:MULTISPECIES: DedA family protein [Cellulomonas]MBO0901416.1 DedA family protein [Cellulomonas sp. zg-ZUI22]MBO0924716.1 DedA family protein [Cellulomonas wangleii]QVI62902.1 DedA family protein [Cellulomonas wangleii]